MSRFAPSASVDTTDIECPSCDGRGWQIELRCCGRGQNGVCCDDPEAEQVDCNVCRGSGIATESAPTAWAYEQAAKATWKHRARAEAAEAEVSRLSKALTATRKALDTGEATRFEAISIIDGALTQQVPVKGHDEPVVLSEWEQLVTALRDLLAAYQYSRSHGAKGYRIANVDVEKQAEAALAKATHP